MEQRHGTGIRVPVQQSMRFFKTPYPKLPPVVVTESVVLKVVLYR